MGLRAKLYIGAVVLAGSAMAIYSLFTSTWPHGLRFGILALIGALAAGMKVKLPGIAGTMSVSYVFILSAILDLSLAQSIGIALISALVQCVWHAKERPKTVPILFNCSSMALAASVAYGAFQALPASAFLMARLALAASAYFLVNTGSIAGVVAVTENRNMFAIWRTSYLWSFPYYFVGASIAAVGAHLTRYVGWETSLVVVPVVFIVYRSYGLYLKQLAREKEHAESLAALHLRTIEALALAIEAKDQTTGEHLKRVQVYAREIAAELGIGEDEKNALQAASILHDIGKLAVPDYIISKPGKLTPEEFEKMKIHPVVGAEILERINFPYPVVPIVRAHHEKWDGSGYPYGLRAEEIPIGARILSAVDCFDALASDRQYRKALPLDEALGIVSKESGRAFDPAVVGVLQRRYLELEKLACAEPAIEELKLSIDLIVKRGDAPDAGYEEAAARPVLPEQTSPSAHLSPAAARHQIQALYEFIQECDTALDTTEILSLIAARLRTIAPYDAAVIYINEGKTLIPLYATGENQKVFSALRIRVGQGVCGWVQENHKPILNGNPAVEPGYRDHPDGGARLESVLAVPLDGFSKNLGVLALYRAGKAAFSQDHLRSLQAIKSKLSRAIEISLPRHKSAAPPDHDTLTGLPNAHALFRQVEAEVDRCARERSSLALLICDLDAFRHVNTQFGRDAGDRLLRSVGAILQQRFAGHGFVARAGGDEFAVLIPGLDAHALASKIKEIEQLIPNRSVGANLPALSVSVGASVQAASEANAERLLNAADAKLYEAKSRRPQATPDYSGLLTLSQSVAAGVNFEPPLYEAQLYEAPVYETDAVRQAIPKG